METPEVCEYPDSGKDLATGEATSTAPFRIVARRDAGLDYWDGEP
jgi:hypothetical protein